MAPAAPTPSAVVATAAVPPAPTVPHVAAPADASAAAGALAVTLARRDLKSRYLRSQLGALLTVLQPVLWLGTAVLAFYGLMGAGVDRSGGAAGAGGGGGGWLGYAARTAAALAVWLPLAECWGRAPNGFAAQAPLVRRTRFPLRAIPASLCLAALVTGAISLVLAVICGLCAGVRFSFDSVPLLCSAVGLALVWMMAGALFLSAVGIFFRDLNSLIGHFLTLGMLVTPVYYDVNVVPVRWQWAVEFNPLSAPAVCARLALTGGDAVETLGGWPILWRVGYSLGLGLIALAVGSAVFRRLGPRIAEQV